MIKQATYLTICIFLGVCLSACTDYIDNRNTPTVVDGNMVEVSIATNVPTITVQTRSTTEASKSEKKLNHVDILVFKVDGDGDEVFAYRTKHANDLSELNYDNDVSITAKLKISDSNEEYRVVFIANLEAEINAYFNKNSEEGKVGTLKQELLEELTFEQAGKWLTGDDGRALPMWGETSSTTAIDKGTNGSAFGKVDMLRSVARIGLSVNLSSATELDGSDQFKIQSVKVHNVRKIGRAVPDEGIITEGKVSVPSLALVQEGEVETVNFKYSGEEITNNQLSNIYVNEAANKDGDDNLFLVVGAIYKGEDPNNTKITYYRIDFYDKNSKLVDILRNYTYNMIITGVDGPGEEDEEKAAESTSNQLTAVMTDWSDGEMKYVVFNAENYLAVSESTLGISRAATSHSFYVQTNYEGGWKAVVKEGGDWISEVYPDVSSTKDQKVLLSFNVSENSGLENRVGVIRLSCGEEHLALDVKIIQSTEVEYTLLIEIDDQDDVVGSYIGFDNTITFTSGYHDVYKTKQIASRTLKVTWTPEDEELKVDYNRYFDWGDGTSIKTTYTGGSAEIEVIPNRLEERNDWFPEAVGDIQMQVGEESSTRQNVLIRRKHHEVYIEKADIYIVEPEKEYSFKLFANTNWVIKSPFSDDQEWLGSLVDTTNLVTRGESNLRETMENSGDDIKFKFRKNISGNISSDVSILIEFEDLGETISKEYTFHIYREESPGVGTRFGGQANCYVLQAGGKSVSIPVSQANRWSEKIKGKSNVADNTNPISEGQKLEVEFLWADSPNGFHEDAPVVSAIMDPENDTGPGARLIVTSGNQAGNAVIAVKSSAGIHWSWHIWVVDDGFNPYDESIQWDGMRYYEFLDRNIGALSKEKGARENLGLYYQWGRKDPFPATDGIWSTTLSKRYRQNGDEIKWTDCIYRPVDSEIGWEKNTLGRTIQDPHLFLTPSSTTNWYSSTWNAYESYDFWNEMEAGSISTSEKGIFDPCPEGWKTIPAGAQLNEEWNQLHSLINYDSNGNYSTVKGGDIDLGVWPHQGYINGQDGAILNREVGEFWTGTPNEVNEAFRTVIRNKGNAEASATSQRRNGMPVRCMRRVATLKD